MSHTEFYFAKIAAAFVRGTLSDSTLIPGQLEELWTAPLEALLESEIEAIVQFGLDQGLRLHRFKRTMGLARVHRVLGILKGMSPEALLDIGSGRGAFLWPLIEEFPEIPVTAIDCDLKRVIDIRAVGSGGIPRLSAHEMDVMNLNFLDHAFDVVTALEVLEHIPAFEQAIRECCRVARRFVIISVPSHEDDNPEHIHLFDQTRLVETLRASGANRVTCEYVLNHLIVVAGM
ncbi:MAG: class I SAM-dependent methyltransferase [Acidobacteria bacterium]|nr:class I SAM-dependent methyltransferase [Acidobacteriota bacterium]